MPKHRQSATNDQGTLDSDIPAPDFFHIVIPSTIYLKKDLTFFERFMLVDIASFLQDGGKCFASNSHWAERFDMSPSRVSETISSLEKQGYITTSVELVGKKVSKRHIKLTKKGAELWMPPYENHIRKTEEPYSEKPEGKESTIKESNEGRNISVAQMNLLGEQEIPAKTKKPCRFENSGITELPMDWLKFARDRNWSPEKTYDEFDKFSSYWQGATKNATSPNWAAKWRTWVLNNYSKGNGNEQGSGNRYQTVGERNQESTIGAAQRAYSRVFGGRDQSGD